MESKDMFIWIFFFFFWGTFRLTSACLHQDEACIPRARVVHLAWTAHDTSSAGISQRGAGCPRALGVQTGVPGSLLLSLAPRWRAIQHLLPVSPSINWEEHILSLCRALGSVDDKHFLQRGVSSSKTISQGIYQARHWATYAFLTWRLHMLLSWSCSKSET